MDVFTHIFFISDICLLYFVQQFEMLFRHFDIYNMTNIYSHIQTLAAAFVCFHA